PSRDFGDEFQSDAAAPVGRIIAPFNLAPGESREFVFVISWHFPNLHTGQGQMYANWFKDALEVARHVRDHDRRLFDQTELFRKTYYEDTTLPWWLALRLMMPTANLATGTAQWWKNGRFWGWEGVGCCHGTCTHVWNYSHAEARLFPELARSTRVMQDLGTGFEETTGRVAFRGEVDKGFAYAADGQAGTVLKCYREHLCSPDGSFLRANWARIKKVVEFLLLKDAERRSGDPYDGIIEGSQHNTFDIDFVGPNTFVGSLYLAALRAGGRMAAQMNDHITGAIWHELAFTGARWTEANLFNGRWFTQKLAPGQDTRWQYGGGCLADQLFGQTWSKLLDLGNVYDPEKVRTALRSVYQHNFAPPGGSLGVYNAQWPPEREFAAPREGGVLTCTWPDGGRPGEPVRYRDEVWTGIEYQVATGLILEGLVDEGLTIIKAIDDRYDGALHNPWNEVECGDHYARAMASWGAYQALCGFIYDGPAGEIGFDPRITPDKFAAFFAGAEGWGLLRQDRSEPTQLNRIEVRYGKLRVARFLCRTPDARAPVSLRVILTSSGRERVITADTDARRDGMKVVELLDSVTLQAGDSLDLRWTF
ncbi:MAG: GH116 family glycosyl hydrolase, partial [Phycisphaerales bacterium]